MWRKNSVQQSSDSLFAHGQVQQHLSAIGGDAPRREHALFGPVAAKGLIDRVTEQVLHLDPRQVAGAEGLVLLPQPIGDLADRAL
jgi:hypothetical protein